MEPLFFKAENKLSPATGVAAERLQWSRFFSKRKIYGRPQLLQRNPYMASMEPLFFKAENVWAVTGFRT